MQQRPLDGRVGLVTGAGRGIGRATAIALADAGAAVVLGARTRSELDAVAAEISGRGGRAVVCELDVTDAASVDHYVATALHDLGRIDLLVNNAGSNNGADGGAVGPLWEIDADAWWRDV